MIKVVSIVGARPQFIKAAVMSKAIRRYPRLREKILHTGQHYDDKMSSMFFRELKIPRPYKNLNIGPVGGNKISRRETQLGLMLQGIGDELLKEKPDVVVVYGDTNSTRAGAVAAAGLSIPVAHVEAGLRSFNREMPEEMNRIIADSISSLLFVPTKEAVGNLRAEGITKGVHRVGDIMIDAIKLFAKQSRRLPLSIIRKWIPSHPYFVLTLHRQENTDNAARLRKILKELGQSPLPFIFPVHPRTEKAIVKNKLKLPENIQTVSPASYLEMILLQDRSEAVWTDSGGMQKEAVVLGKPCFTLREETEWVETVASGWNVLIGADPKKYQRVFQSQEWKRKRTPFSTRRHYGDGHSAERMAEILCETFS